LTAVDAPTLIRSAAAIRTGPGAASQTATRPHRPRCHRAGSWDRCAGGRSQAAVMLAHPIPSVAPVGR